MSGPHSAAQRANFARRPGAPGGLQRSVAQKQGLPTDPEPQGIPNVTDADLVAFLLGDAKSLRTRLGIFAWDNSPLVNFDAHPGSVRTVGDQHAREYRRRLISAIEERGALRWCDLDAADAEVRLDAWQRLSGVSAAVGVAEERWRQVVIDAGWTWEPDEGETSDGGA